MTPKLRAPSVRENGGRETAGVGPPPGSGQQSGMPTGADDRYRFVAASEQLDHHQVRLLDVRVAYLHRGKVHG